MKSLLLLALLLPALAPGAQAAGCSRPIKLGASPIGLSMVIDDANHASGVVPDFLAGVTVASGCRFDYLPMPRIRGVSEFRAGNIDLLSSAIQTPERDAVGIFIPTMRSPVALISLKGRLSPADALQKLAAGSLTVNVVRGHDYGPQFIKLLASLRAQGRLEEVDSSEVVLKKLLAGRADATITLAATLADAATRLGVGEDIQVTPMASLPESVSGFYLSRHSLAEADRRLLLDAIGQAVRRGEYWRIYTRYYPAWAVVGLKPVAAGN